jgi:hypothetical protein
MGKQFFRILLIAGLVLSYVHLTNAEDPAASNRAALLTSLKMLAWRAQDYYHTSDLDLGGGGSFASLTLSYLTSQPSTPNGYIYLSSPSATSVSLTATGYEIGFDGYTPLEIEVIVYSDSMTVTVTN